MQNENSDGTLSCRICGKVASGSQKTGILGQHMEIHIDGVSYQCQLCDKTFRSKHILPNHKFTNTEIINVKILNHMLEMQNNRKLKNFLLDDW